MWGSRPPGWEPQWHIKKLCVLHFKIYIFLSFSLGYNLETLKTFSCDIMNILKMLQLDYRNNTTLKNIWTLFLKSPQNFHILLHAP